MSKFEPNYRHVIDAACNRQAERLPLYEHGFDAKEKEKLGDKREQYFKEFGNLFAESKNKQLSRYGRSLAKSKAKPKPTAEKLKEAI